MPSGVNLMYHRIAHEELDPWRLCVEPGHFAEHLEVLRGAGVRLLHVSDMARALACGALPRRCVAITFDDGYRDNLEQGKGILERFEIPATLFVASGYVGSEGEFWWDVLDRVFLEAGELPQRLEMTVGGEARCWDLGRGAAWSEEDAANHRDWAPASPPQCARHRLHQEFRDLLLSSDAADRAGALAALLDWAGVPATARPSRRILDGEGLRRMAGDGLVEIGGHSVSHPDLTRLSLAEQEHELTASKSSLEAVLGRPVSGFAYPHGESRQETRDLARRAGYSFACGVHSRPVRRGSDLYDLPRIEIGNVPGAVFRSKIRQFIPI
jgi:peptidoglycan/xylan/chitin deacetylase (PgdA/CDA1 family)